MIDFLLSACSADFTLAAPHTLEKCLILSLCAPLDRVLCMSTQLGWTPLHAAIICPPMAATAMVELLLAAGAAVDARNGVRERRWGGEVDGA